MTAQTPAALAPPPRPCPYCNGTGKVWLVQLVACSSCRGTGRAPPLDVGNELVNPLPLNWNRRKP